MVKEVYNPKAFIPHAASLRQASAHCAIFPTAASRRSLGRVSVPVWPVALSGRLPVIALVGHYPTNKLIGREPIPDRKKPFHPTPCGTRSYPVLDPVSQAYPRVRGRLLTCYSPVRRSCTPEGALPLDLHVLSTPPAFVLSQDQTLHHRPKHQPPPHTQQTVCVQTGGGKPYKSSTPTRHPTHTTRARHQIKRNPHPHKPRGQEGAKNHTNPAVKKQPRAVEFSRNNRQPSTNPHGLFPGCGTNPYPGPHRKPRIRPFVLYFTGFLRDHQIGVSDFSDKARTEIRRQFFAAQ